MSRIASSRNTTESEIDPSIKSKVDRYAAKIVSLQSENIKLNDENQLLAQKFNNLTEYNQTLGNDLANFDEEIVFLEQQISQKTTEFKQLSKKADNLDKQIKTCRKTLLDDADFSQAANKLKKLEEKKIAVMKKLSELKGDSINNNDPGILQTRALLLEEVKLLEQANSDLMQEKALLQILIDTDKTVAQKKSTLEEMIKKKDKEQNKLLDEIQVLRQNNPQELSKLLHMSLSNIESQTNSEYADDEANDQEATKNANENLQNNEKEMSSKDFNAQNDQEATKNANDNAQNDEKEMSSKDLNEKETNNENEGDNEHKNESISESNNDENKKGEKSQDKQQNSISESENSRNSSKKSKKDKSSKNQNLNSDNDDDYADSDEEPKESESNKNKKKTNDDKDYDYSEDDRDQDEDDKNHQSSRRKRHHSSKKNKKNRKKDQNERADSDSEKDEYDDENKNDKKSKEKSSKRHKKAASDSEKNDYDDENQNDRKSKEKSSKHHKRAASESRKGKNKTDKNEKEKDSNLSDDQQKDSHHRKRHSNKKDSKDDKLRNNKDYKRRGNKGADDYSDNYEDDDYNSDYESEYSADSTRRHKHKHNSKKRTDKRSKSPSKNENEKLKEKSKKKSKNSTSSSKDKATNNNNNDKDKTENNINKTDPKNQPKKESESKNSNTDQLTSQKVNQSTLQSQLQIPKNATANSDELASSNISAFASVRRKVKKPTADLVNVESQTNEEEISPVLKGLGSGNCGVSDREREALAKLDSLKEEIESKLAEKKELQEKLNKPRPKFTISDKLSVSFSPLPDAVHDLSLRLFKHHSIGAQTDVSGETIDFHNRLLQSQVSEMTVASDLQDEIQNLQKQIATVNESISKAKQEGETRDHQIKKVKEDLKKAKKNIESEQQNQDLETRMKNEIMNEIAALKVEIREKQGELESQTEKNQQMQTKLDELIKVRQSLERDIEDMSMREKPEIQTLSQQVHTYSGRVREAEMKLKKAEDDLESKREILLNLKKSDEMKNYKDLSIKKVKLERRLNKWKMLLKDSRETMQSLEAFSRQNFQRRQYLAQQLEKYEREKADKEEELRDLESYSALLNALLLEQNENWS